MFNKFWNNIGLGKSGIWQKIKWIIVTLIIFIPNALLYYTCKLGDLIEGIWFDNAMPAIFKWIKK